MNKAAMKLALGKIKSARDCHPNAVDILLFEAEAILETALTEQPAQQEPVAYDKTEINCFAQDLYDQKMREGKRGHYESMFHVIHQCIKKVSPPAQRTWVGLTLEDMETTHWSPDFRAGAKWAAAKLKEKNT